MYVRAAEKKKYNICRLTRALSSEKELYLESRITWTFMIPFPGFITRGFGFGFLGFVCYFLQKCCL